MIDNFIMHDNPNDINPFTPFQPSDNSDINDLNNSYQSNTNYNDISNQYSQNVSSQSIQQEDPDNNVVQDERIVDYLIKTVIPSKNPEMPADQLVREKDRLYKILENGIFDTAYSQLHDDQKKELDTLMQYGADIPAIQTFFIEKIPNIQEQLGLYMQSFVDKYLKSEI